MTGLAQHLGSQAPLPRPPLWIAARSTLQEAGQGGFSRVAVQRVGSLPELDAVKQPLNVARDRVRSHDERGIKRMDVFACHRTLGMAHERRDGHLGKTEIVGDTREAVTEDV